METINLIYPYKCGRCQSFTQKSNGRLKCKKIARFIVLDNRFCITHANILFKNLATIIQKTYRGHKVRQYLKTLYKRLPDDLQKKIIFYIRENYLIKKHHHNVIRNILDKKVTKDYISNLEFGDNLYSAITYDEQIANIRYLTYVFNLYDKYHSLVPFDKMLLLYSSKHLLLKLVDTLFMMNMYDEKIVRALYLAIQNFRREPKIVPINY